jgi:hypothetical protein
MFLLALLFPPQHVELTHSPDEDEEEDGNERLMDGR